MSGEEAELVLSTVADQTEHVDPETFSMPEVCDEIPWGGFTEWTAVSGRHRGDGQAEDESGRAFSQVPCSTSARR